LLQCAWSRPHLNHHAVFQVPLREGTTPSAVTLLSSKMPTLKAATSAPRVDSKPARTAVYNAPIAQRVVMASIKVLRQVCTHIAASAQAATSKMPQMPPPATLVPRVVTGNFQERPTRHALMSVHRASSALLELRAHWPLASAFTWRISRQRSKSRAPWASSSQA
jgi:hypothetical protein